MIAALTPGQLAAHDQRMAALRPSPLSAAQEAELNQWEAARDEVARWRSTYAWFREDPMLRAVIDRVRQEPVESEAVLRNGQSDVDEPSADFGVRPWVRWAGRPDVALTVPVGQAPGTVAHVLVPRCAPCDRCTGRSGLVAVIGYPAPPSAILFGLCHVCFDEIADDFRSDDASFLIPDGWPNKFSSL